MTSPAVKKYFDHTIKSMPLLVVFGALLIFAGEARVEDVIEGHLIKHEERASSHQPIIEMRTEQAVTAVKVENIEKSLEEAKEVQNSILQELRTLNNHIRDNR